MASGGLSAIAMTQSLEDTWCEFALGWTATLNKRTAGYFEVSRNTGDQAKTPWQVNAGVRWSF
jgi:outer membrane autotransporter barrel domain